MTAQSKINLARLPLYLMFAVEALALYSSLYIAASLRSGGLIDNIEAITPRAIVFTGVMLLGLSSMGLYQFHQRFYFQEIIGRIIAGLIFGALSLIVIGYAVPALEITAAIGAISALYSLAMLLMIRFFFVPNSSEIFSAAIRWFTEQARRRVLFRTSGAEQTDAASELSAMYPLRETRLQAWIHLSPGMRRPCWSWQLKCRLMKSSWQWMIVAAIFRRRNCLSVN